MADSATDLQIDGKSIYSLRVVDLKQELKKRDITFKGNATKAQLQSLLIETLSQINETNDDKSSEDRDSGTTVQSDDTNDTIESNSEANNVQTLAPIKEQTEPTDLSQDSGITSSVSFEKQSIKLTIKLQPNDSPRQMSPKKSPTKEILKSQPIEEKREITKVSETKQIESREETVNIPETETICSEPVQKIAPEVQKVQEMEKVVVPPEQTSNVPIAEEVIQSYNKNIEPKITPQEVIKESNTELIESNDIIHDMSKHNKPEAKQSVSPNKGISENKEEKQVKGKLEGIVEQKESVVQELKSKISEEVIPEKSVQIDVIKDSNEKSEETNVTKELSSETPETNKILNQEIVLTEEVSEDLIEQKSEISDKEITETEKPIDEKPKESIKENERSEKSDQIRRSSEKENKTEVDTNSERRPRRRRWGGSVSSSDAQTNLRKGISSDQLKELIPDLGSTDNSSTTSKVSKSDSIVVTSSLSRTQTAEANNEVPIKQDIRVVRKSVSVQEEEQTSKPSPPAVKQKPKVVEPEIETKEVSEERAVSPPRKSESNVIFIQNLVRPFTLLQLKEVLGKTGKLIEERFWIDKIKSKCFASYETTEEAVATRLALHGTRWPTSNPKILSVDFATKEELDSYLNPELSHQELSHQNKKSEDNQKYDIVIKSEEQRIASRDKENKTESRPIREWDREKLSKEEDRRAANKRRESPEKDRDGKKRRTGEERVRPADSTSGEQPVVEAAKETESPAKLLDDLFRKTNATPSIYWLPLTEEQATARSAQREEEEKKRAEERAAREEQFRKRQEESPRRRPMEASPPFRNERNKWRPDSPPNRRFGRRGSPPFRRSPPGRRSPPRRRSPVNRYSRSRSRSPFPRRKR